MNLCPDQVQEQSGTLFRCTMAVGKYGPPIITSFVTRSDDLEDFFSTGAVSDLESVEALVVGDTYIDSSGDTWERLS